MRLLLSDFDWPTRTFTVRRSKRGGLQQFPICRELSEAILSYVKNARPQCSCPNLFVSFHPPYGPMHPCSLSEIVKLRMKHLGIRSRKMGAPQTGPAKNDGERGGRLVGPCVQL